MDRMLSRGVVVATSALTALLSVGALHIPAAADPNCTGEFTRNTAWAQDDQTHRGAFVGAWRVYGHNNPDNAPNRSVDVTCQRVETLDVFDASDKQMEIGWTITPLNNHVCPIDPSNPQQPFFAEIKTTASGQICLSGSNPLQLTLTSHSMKETDPNANGSWSFYLDGNPKGSGTTSWSKGWVVANTEHHVCCGDSAYGDFDLLKYIDSSGPVPWDDAKLFCDISDHYDAGKVAGNDFHLIMQQPSSQHSCPE